MADHPVTIVVDWDDTVVGYHRFGTEGEPLPGAVDALKELLRDGYAVTVASCRVTWGDGLTEILSKLAEFEFDPVLVVSGDVSEVDVLRGPDLMKKVVSKSPASGELGVWVGVGKPIGSVYLDDRGAQFTNDWETALEEINERAPL